MSDFGRAVLGNAFYASIGLYTEYAAGLAISIIVARHLGAKAYGTYTLLMWLVSVGVVFVNHGITTGVMKFLGEACGQRAPALAASVLRYFERMQLWSALAVCSAISVFILFAADRIVVDSQAAPLLWILVPAIALRSLYVFYVSAAKGVENFRLVARVHAIIAPIGVIIMLAATRWGTTLRDFVVAYLLICLVYTGVMRFWLSRTRPREHDTTLSAVPVGRIHRHVVYASAIVAFELLALRQTELFFLDRFSTPANLAYYGIGKTLSTSAMLLIPGVVTALLLPLMSRTFGESPGLLGGRFLAATRYILILVVPVVTVCEVFAADLITLLYGSAYRPAVLVLRITIATAAVGAVSSSASSYQLGTDRQPAIVAIMAAVAAFTVVLDYVLIRAYQLNGAIAAGAVGSVLLGAALLWHARRSLRVRFDSHTYVRILAAGALAAVPAMIARATLPVWLALPVGAILLATVYLPLTVVVGGWTRGDVQSMRALAGMVPPFIGVPVAELIQRAAEATSLVPKEAG